MQPAQFCCCSSLFVTSCLALVGGQRILGLYVNNMGRPGRFRVSDALCLRLQFFYESRLCGAKPCLLFRGQVITEAWPSQSLQCEYLVAGESAGKLRRKSQGFIHGWKSGYRVVWVGTALAPERRGGAGSVFKNPGMTTPEGVPRKI
jgi:hypothetical protein